MDFKALQKTLLNIWKIVFKVATGLIIVPLSFFTAAWWPWWQKQTGIKKYASAIIILPVAGFCYVAAPWWESLK